MDYINCPLEPLLSDDCLIDKYIDSIVSQASDLPELDPLLWSEEALPSELIEGDAFWSESGSNENSNQSGVNHFSSIDAQESTSPSPSKNSLSDCSDNVYPEDDVTVEEVIEEFVEEEIPLAANKNNTNGIVIEQKNVNSYLETNSDYYSTFDHSSAARTFEIHNYCCIKYDDDDGDEEESNSLESSPKAKPANKGVKRRAITDLRLTEEEKKLLAKEGYNNFPGEKKELTYQEEKILRKIRRKIRNKRSAQFSRQRKKQYVEELEKKYEECTNENEHLKREVEELRRENQSLLIKMRKILKDHTSNGQASFKTSLFVILLSFLFILMPAFRPDSMDDGLMGGKHQQQMIRTGRQLLMTLGGHEIPQFSLNESENTINFTNTLSI